MTYANVVFSCDGGVPAGPASEADASGHTPRFIRRMAECGVDALILPDVPLEEKEEFAVPCREFGIDFISLIAPTSHERVRKAAADADGFLYCVSSLGVTGTRDAITTDIGGMVRLAKEAAPELPCAVGFGISTPEQAAEMAALSDGAIVGSAIVKLCGKYGRDCVGPVAEYVREMAAAVHRAGPGR
ncbi:MAG: tryptophan synthase subunit alpha, partial [Lachnospiraceae bacterium]|nr:tryptophan synthase subunit alpha [Lachnospiraceae bacterium]